MAIWKEQNSVKKESPPMSAEPAVAKPTDARLDLAASYDAPRRPVERETKESVIAADLTIEGKIEGTGHVRIAGRFKGDVNVQGNLTIEVGAKLTGGVRANTVTIAGELEGNIDAASRVELLDSGVLNGDLKAGSLIVAAGSRMRGQVEFGWEDKAPKKPTMTLETGFTQ
jgi:cytoskeletal protein CcmA (bactofilin family)